ncbi:hypothetical protein [Bradyrhizobium sp. URHD0069]|uniref:hypothetical protein n=1 Tax=Bradyrhizobium sp. URHD0069 TaxID=1380355 RepID=UPI0004957E31|nr:hypothetical protein [Bradyrhizobium sp. URHD0069]
MTSPLEGALRAQVYKGMRGLFLDAVLTRDVIPDSPAYDPADPPAPVPVPYACKAIVEDYSAGVRAGGLVNATDVNIIILAASLSVEPQAGDRLSVPSQGVSGTIAGPATSGTSSMKAVSTDPARATWSCRTVT